MLLLHTATAGKNIWYTYVAVGSPLLHAPGGGGGGEGGLPYEECTGVCHGLGSYFQEKSPKRVCQIFTKVPERAVISVRNSR